MTKQMLKKSESRIGKFFSPLIDCNITSVHMTEDSPCFDSLLLEAQQIAGRDYGNCPEAAIAWLTTGETAFSSHVVKIGELTQSSHAMMLDALLNALPIADISSDEPNVMSDTSTRADFENVCPVRFLALFPIASEWIQRAGYLVLYDVKPMDLEAGASSALTALARRIATANQ